MVLEQAENSQARKAKLYAKICGIPVKTNLCPFPGGKAQCKCLVSFRNCSILKNQHRFLLLIVGLSAMRALERKLIKLIPWITSILSTIATPLMWPFATWTWLMSTNKIFLFGCSVHLHGICYLVGTNMWSIHLHTSWPNPYVHPHISSLELFIPSLPIFFPSRPLNNQPSH